MALKKELTAKIHIQYSPIKVAFFLTAYVYQCILFTNRLARIHPCFSLGFCHVVTVAFCCFYNLQSLYIKCVHGSRLPFNTIWRGKKSDCKSQLTDLHRLQSSVTPHLWATISMGEKKAHLVQTIVLVVVSLAESRRSLAKLAVKSALG